MFSNTETTTYGPSPDALAFDQLVLVALSKLIERQLPGTDQPTVGRIAVAVAEEAFKARAEALQRIADEEPTPGVSREVGAQESTQDPGTHEEV